MPFYETPGVHYERADASAPAISVVRTDIAGFVGLAPRGLVDVAVPVESWRQYQAHYGSFTGSAFLAYTVRAFFENGGRRCWIVRVASADPAAGAAAAAIAFGAATAPFWSIEASSPGVWGNNLSVEIRQTHSAQTIIVPGWQNARATPVAAIAGFDRGTLVRLSQPNRPPILRVVSAIDASVSALVWVHEDPLSRLPYDQPLTGLDAAQPVVVESVEYTLIVRELGAPIAVYERLAPMPEHPRYACARLAPLPSLNGRYAGGSTLPPLPEPIVVKELRERYLPLDAPPGLPATAMSGGRDGLSLLGPYDFVGEDSDPRESDQQRARKTRGVRALAAVEEVSILAVPDIHVQAFPEPIAAPIPCVPDPCLPGDAATPALIPAAGELPPVFSDDEIYRVQGSIVDHCELMRDRVFIIDPPLSASRHDAVGLAAIRAWRQRFDSSYAALYYPWIKVVDPLRGAAGITRDIPPSGHVAGQYASADFTVGVHKAPANVELTWAQDTTAPVDDARHGLLNSDGIDAIVALTGRGVRIMGARTVSSDPSWRFINVRRLLIMIRRALLVATQWAVFEPNDAITRAKLKLSIVSFLIALWQRGALAGARVDAALRVICDEGNNTDVDRANGRLTADVLVAPSVPFEFVAVRVGRVGNQFEIQETSGVAEVA